MAKRVVEVFFGAKDKTKQGVKSVASGLKKIRLGHAAVAAAAGVATKKVVDFIKNQVDAIKAYVQGMANLGDAVDKMSARISESVEEVVKWDFVMQRAGGSSADMETSIKRLSVSMLDNQRNVAKSVEIWDELGISVTNADGDLRNASDVMLDLADALGSMEDRAKASAFAQETLGRGGLKMLAAFKDGSAGIIEQWELLERLNGGLSKEFTDGAAQIIDAETDIQFAVKGLKADLIEPFQSDIADVLETIALAVGKVGKAVDDNKGTLENLGETAADVAQALTRMLFPQEAMMSRKFGKWVRQTADDNKELEDKTKDTTAALDDEADRMKKMIRLLEIWNVETHKTVVDPVTLEVKIVPKTEAEILAEVQAAVEQTQAIIDAGVIDAPEIPLAFVPDEAGFDRTIDALMEIQEVTAETRRQEEAMMDAIERSQDQAADLFETVGSAMSREISTFLLARNGALMLGRAIRNSIIPALVDMIVKLTVVRGLMAAFRMPISPSGSLPSAFGGKAPVASQMGGGPAQLGGKGFGQPGGSLTSQLNNMMAAQSQATMKSPMEVVPSGGDIIKLLPIMIGRPVGRLDEIAVGRSLAAAVQYAEEELI